MRGDTMKPRFEQQSYEVTQLMEKAAGIDKRIAQLEEAEKCPECEGKGAECKCKEKCPSCGEELEKGACMKMGCGGKMEKAEGEFRLPKEKITDVHPEIHSESGGQTRNAYYTTNGTSIESEVAKPKRKKDDKKTDVEGLGRRMNPHEGSGAEKENFTGGERRIEKSPKAMLREAGEGGKSVLCGTCGGSNRTGCLLHRGMDIHACPKFVPLN